MHKLPAKVFSDLCSHMCLMEHQLDCVLMCGCVVVCVCVCVPVCVCVCVCVYMCRYTGLTDDRHPGVSAGERPEVHLSMSGKKMYSYTYRSPIEFTNVSCVVQMTGRTAAHTVVLSLFLSLFSKQSCAVRSRTNLQCCPFRT